MSDEREAFDQSLYRYRARLVRVVDGDTVRVQLSLGVFCYREVSIRIAGIDAPELFSGDHRDAGLASRVHLQELLADADDGVLFVRTYKDARSFDRYVADIGFTQAGEWVDAATEMIADGYAARWAPHDVTKMTGVTP